MIAAAVGGAGFILAVLRKQSQTRRLAAFDTLTCGLCGSESLAERGPGRYACSACGYDTGAEQTPDQAAAIQQLQDLAIAITCLESATAEFSASRYRPGSDSSGPFFEHYLEGIEQIEEALRLLMPVADVMSALEPALSALERVPPPADRKRDFNSRVSAAIELISTAQSTSEDVRAALLERLQSGAPDASRPRT